MEREKPCCRGIAHGSHHPVEERQLPGRPVSQSAPTVVVLRGGGQIHGPLSCGINLPPAHPRRSLGGSRPTRFERRRTEQELASLNFKARAKGFRLIPIYAKADVEALRSVALDPEEVTDAK